MRRPRFRARHRAIVTRTTVALTLLALSPLTSIHEAAAQNVGAESAAQQRYARGRELFFAKSYAEALKEFRAANELVASPNTRLYIARCERELGHGAAAFVEYERAATEAADRARTDPRYTTTRDHARSESAALEPKLARVVVKVPKAPEGTSVTVGGQALPRAGWDLVTPVDPGEIEVLATAPGCAPFKKKLTASAGQTSEMTITLDESSGPIARVTPVAGPPLAPPPAAQSSGGDGTNGEVVPESPTPETKSSGGGVRTLGFVTLGVGVVGIGVFAIVGGMAKSRFDEVKNACGGARCTDASQNAKIDGGERMQLVANVSLAVGAVAAVVGLVMIAAGGPSTTATDPPKNASGLKLWGGPLDHRGGMVGARIGF